jgi:ATP-dependent Clp protease ATP-binding subunit ClpB
LQHELETRIGRALIAGDVLEGATIHVDVREDALTTAIENPEPEAVSAVA